MPEEKVTPGMERIERIKKAWINLATFMPDDLEDFIDAEIEIELLRVVRGMEAEAVNIRKMFLYHMADEISDYLDEYLVQLRKDYGLEDTP